MLHIEQCIGLGRVQGVLPFELKIETLDLNVFVVGAESRHLDARTLPFGCLTSLGALSELLWGRFGMVYDLGLSVIHLLSGRH